MHLRVRDALHRVLKVESADLPIDELVLRAERFRPLFNRAKDLVGPVDFTWYPYDSLANFRHLSNCLTGPNRRILQYAGSNPILDIGCADGATTFFLELLGFPVHAVDNPPTNYNAMHGVRRLAKQLNSSATIHAIDLDEGQLPAKKYGLAFFLGTLYHLKNPIRTLEGLSQRVQYCLLSTRVTALAEDRATSLQPLSVAYLATASSCNDDSTNYWIFSETGLRTLLERTGWRILDMTVVGSTNLSDPVTDSGDARAFCLVESTAVWRSMVGIDWIEGWHAIENEAWRWTHKRFAFGMLSGQDTPTTLQFTFSLPRVVLEQHDKVELQASVNGVRLPSETYDFPGEHVYSQNIPPEAIGASPSIHIDFELNQAICGIGEDGRELGLQVAVNPAPIVLF